MKNSTQESYTGFEYPASVLAKYIRAGDIFTMMLKDGSIVHHTIKEYELFEKWLMDNNIQNIKQNEVKTEPGEKSRRKI